MARRSQDTNAERKAYDAAFGLLKDGRYSEAASAFSDFVEKYPEGPYSDNAQYWLGESRYVTRDFGAALEAFRKVVSNYPDSAKVPDARLKIGYSLYELERIDEAREALEQVMQEHDNSAVARLAEERLLKIKEESG
ncbi:MAG: tol-pal system protein YbgF [Halofilum sp. (in: g-proteobacteria)]|nr:tol-pal system protein YbgF [Halofilum sp. (in: g-proteobacteria)]